MTEVVTSSAASSQLTLLAQRQQAFGVSVERQGEDSGFVTADIAAAATDTAQDASAQSHSSFDDQNPVNRHQDEAPQRAREAAPPPSGPSKARVEIKHIDLGLTPSEVVGTPDILQRFDSNGDGRVDLIEAARAGVAREGVFTFAGLASANEKTDEQPAAEVVQQPQTAVAADAAPVVADADGRRLFTPAEAGAAPGKKFFNAVAAQGAPTGHVDAPKKFYGQGAEVVVGKFAADNAQKLSDKSPGDEKKIVVTDDSGETKLYDKVAQADTDQAAAEENGKNGDADTPPRPRAAPEDGAPAVKKGAHKGVAAYVAEPTPTTTVVTA